MKAQESGGACPASHNWQRAKPRFLPPCHLKLLGTRQSFPRHVRISLGHWCSNRWGGEEAKVLGAVKEGCLEEEERPRPWGGEGVTCPEG